MKLKQFAIKGLAILAVVLALCAFFSGTVRTITTPKVRLTTPKMAKLEEKITITGKIYFPETEEIRPTLPDDTTLTILKVNTRAGYTVDKGDVLIEAEVTGYQDKLDALTKEYEDSESSLAALERKNSDKRVRQADTKYVEAYNAYQTSRSDTLLKEVAMDTLLDREGLELDEEGNAPKGASKELQAAIEEYNAAVEAQAEAEKTWERNKRYSIDEEVYSYLTEKADLEKKMASAQEGIRTLSATNAMAAQLIATHGGYTASVDVNVGDVWDGKKAMMTLSAAKSDPVFRADVTDLEKTVSKKSDVTIPGRYGDVESRVSDVITDTDGRKYAYVDVNKDVLNYVGSVYSLMQSETGKEMTLVYKAKEATCIVPVSAVHGSGEDRYVFTVDQTSNAFGSTELVVHKRNVQVEAEVNGMASLSEDISWYTLAYMEDRAIDDGATVMEYTD